MYHERIKPYVYVSIVTNRVVAAVVVIVCMLIHVSKKIIKQSFRGTKLVNGFEKSKHLEKLKLFV